MYIIFSPKKYSKQGFEYRTMWGTGVDSTVERLLYTTSRAKPITYNIVVLIYHSPIIQFYPVQASKLVLEFAWKLHILGTHAALHKRRTQQHQNPWHILHICSHGSSSQQRELYTPRLDVCKKFFFFEL